jgi:hypothetical protein
VIKGKRLNISKVLQFGESEHEQEEMNADVTEIEEAEEEKTEATQLPILPDIIQRMTSRRNNIISRHVQEVMRKRTAPLSPQKVEQALGRSHTQLKTGQKTQTREKTCTLQA